MSTHLPGFRSFFSFFSHIFVLIKLTTSSIRVNNRDNSHLHLESIFSKNYARWNDVRLTYSGEIVAQFFYTHPTIHYCYECRAFQLTLQMLRLHSSKAQGRKTLWKPSKPCHVGMHWKALAEFSQMSTHVPGFQSISRFLHPKVLTPN